MADPAPAQRWADALASWALPEEILHQAPEDPWVHPPFMFRANPASDPTDTPSHRIARAALAEVVARASGAAGERGEGEPTPVTVLDVGVGGGRSCLPLAAPATELWGVDEQQAMLDQFAEACAAAGVGCRTFLGRWPDVAGSAGSSGAASTGVDGPTGADGPTGTDPGVPVADVVVCHHVAYNVAAIEPFLRALTDRARSMVVVELPAEHPTAWMNRLWDRFWSLPRPSEPSAELFVEVVRSLGWTPEVAWAERQPRTSGTEHTPEFVAFVRRRLCLPANCDAEIADALRDLGPTAPHLVATVAWRP